MYQKSILSLPVIACALGYMVDIYDLLAFNLVKQSSLNGLGINNIDMLEKTAVHILSWQMWGIFLGAIFWGFLGDKIGRSKALFGSILIYSLGNIWNGMIHTPEHYAMIRFVVGVGLAGELGGGVTLVNEMLTKEKRGLSTSIIAAVGMLGVVLAFSVNRIFSWRWCYFVGGGLGLVLLFFRIGVLESDLFKQIQYQTNIQKGNFLLIFSNKERFFRYIRTLFSAVSSWFAIGVLILFVDKYGQLFSIQGKVDVSFCLLLSYMGLSVGNLACGYISNIWKSRKKAHLLFILLFALFFILFFTTLWHASLIYLYALCLAIGFSIGYHTVFIVSSVEQFGTNMRATVASTVPNFIRTLYVIFIIPLLHIMEKWTTSFVWASILCGVVIIGINIIAVVKQKETFGRDLNFLEHV